MGKELIVIRLYNHPRFCYSLKIYNHKANRVKYYDKLIEKLGLKNVNVRSNGSPDMIEFSEELTDTELAYCHFRTAYETIFLCHKYQ
jgi:PP-loop superfamily ATP-utilizing enzyme